MYDIRFFQAAATVIPTLALAVAFASRLFDDETARGRSQRRREHGLPDTDAASMRVVLCVLAIVPTILGERAALVALLYDEPTKQRVYLTMAGIASLGLLLALTVAVGVLYPVLEQLELRRSQRNRWLYRGLLALVTAIVLGLLVWPS